MKSTTSLQNAIINKITGNDNKIAPLFIAPRSPDEEEEEENEDVVELACGHISRRKNDQASGVRLMRTSSGNSLFGNLSVSEATRCPMCEAILRAKKDVRGERESTSSERS